jgi:hypothetical protein
VGKATPTQQMFQKKLDNEPMNVLWLPFKKEEKSYEPTHEQ